MGIRFNADEVFAIAIKIERNGAAFYRKAASLQADEHNKKMLEDLAAMEDGHEQTFITMRQELSEKEKDGQVYDPDEEALLYLNAVSDTHKGEGSPSVADSLTGEESFEKILGIALELEQKSILYYIGLRDFVPPKHGKDKVDAIISEERKHVVQLLKAIKNV